MLTVKRVKRMKEDVMIEIQQMAAKMELKMAANVCSQGHMMQTRLTRLTIHMLGTVLDYIVSVHIVYWGLC